MRDRESSDPWSASQPRLTVSCACSHLGGEWREMGCRGRLTGLLVKRYQIFDYSYQQAYRVHVDLVS